MLQPGMPAQAAELAALCKVEKYGIPPFERTHFCQPITVESLGPMNIVAHSFLLTWDKRFLRFLVTIVRAATCFNTALQS